MSSVCKDQFSKGGFKKASNLPCPPLFPKLVLAHTWDWGKRFMADSSIVGATFTVAHQRKFNLGWWKLPSIGICFIILNLLRIFGAGEFGVRCQVSGVRIWGVQIADTWNLKPETWHLISMDSATEQNCENFSGQFCVNFHHPRFELSKQDDNTGKQQSCYRLPGTRTLNLEQSTLYSRADKVQRNALMWAYEVIK